MVRLKFDDVEKPKRLPKKKKTLKRKKPTDNDFDSEEEYGKENAESSSDYEMDDGHISEGDEDAYEFVKPEEEEEVVEKEEKEEKVIEDRYQIDPFLVRREASLILLAKKGFNKRTIIFFNEKKQVSRGMILFTMFGLKAVEVHGNMS